MGKDIPLATQDIPCPICEKDIRLNLLESGPGTHVTCPHCRETFELAGDDLRKLGKALKKLDDTLKSF